MDAEYEARGLTFGCRTWGDGDETVLALHGFPDEPGTFESLADRLTAAGYRVVAPAMRGYRPTDPAPGGDYSARALGRDAVALGRAVDADLLVGHDWGAVAAYAAAREFPDAFDRVAAMAVPPRLDALMLEHPRQVARSWYVWTFQVPGTEHLLAARDFALVDLLWDRWSPGWDYPEERLAATKEALGGRTGEVLAYYRQFVRGSVARLRNGLPAVEPTIETPTLVLAGAEDGCIGPDVFADAGEAFAGPHRIARVRDAGHFMHCERPDIVADEVLAFFEGD